MKTLCSFVMLAVLFIEVSPAEAVPQGMTLEFHQNPQGVVVFSGDVHARQKLGCSDCHTRIFKQKKGDAKITFSDHVAEKSFCFVCHNGKVAFKASANCNLCHKKKQ